LTASAPVAATTPAAPAWPQDRDNAFHPGHAAAVCLSAVKWVLATLAIVAVVDPARVLGLAYLPIAANWAVPLTRVIGSILVTVAASFGALQLYTEAGLAASPPAEALTLGLLAGAAFRGLHLILYKAFFNPAFWQADAAVAGAATVLLAWRYTALAASRATTPPPRAPGPSLAPLLPGATPLATALGVVGLAFAAAGVLLVGAPPTLGDAVLAAPLGAVGASIRVAIGTGLLFPSAFAAWILKDAADGGALAWPPARALAWGLLISSVARVVAVVGAFNAGVFVAGGAWAVPAVVHGAVAVVAGAAVVKGL
jgi:hypothetical protein